MEVLGKSLGLGLPWRPQPPKIVYTKEQSFIHKPNLDDISFNKLD